MDRVIKKSILRHNKKLQRELSFLDCQMKKKIGLIALKIYGIGKTYNKLRPGLGDAMRETFTESAINLIKVNKIKIYR